MNEFKIGETVRAKVDLFDDACGEHPSVRHARSGDKLTVLSENRPEFRYGLCVERADKATFKFFVSLDEIDKIAPETKVGSG